MAGQRRGRSPGVKRLVKRLAATVGKPSLSDPRYRLAKIGVGVKLGKVRLGGTNVIGDYCDFDHEVEIGYGTTLGRGCLCRGGDIRIGRYCQFAPGVSLYASDHALNRLTLYNNPILFGGELKRLAPREPIEIGHDVWIGAQAVILKGVKIGNGAVIGAGAIVTHDVPAYGIAVGNPARLARMRFDDELIAAIEAVRWWDFPAEELEPLKELFFLDLQGERARAMNLLRDFAASRRYA